MRLLFDEFQRLGSAPGLDDVLKISDSSRQHLILVHQLPAPEPSLPVTIQSGSRQLTGRFVSVLVCLELEIHADRPAGIVVPHGRHYYFPRENRLAPLALPPACLLNHLRPRSIHPQPSTGPRTPQPSLLSLPSPLVHRGCSCQLLARKPSSDWGKSSTTFQRSPRATVQQA